MRINDLGHFTGSDGLVVPFDSTLRQFFLNKEMFIFRLGYFEILIKLLGKKYECFTQNFSPNSQLRRLNC